MKKIAVLGYGVVGSGVVELFYRNQKKIEKNTGTELEIGYILDLREFPDDPYGDRVVHDIQVILDDPEVGYVAECMGGVNPAFDFVRRCLEAGKSVATSNKQLVAEKGDILLQVAKAHHVNFFFEASVGGAIPIIRPLHTCLAANAGSAVVGILNGTTNFILENAPEDRTVDLLTEQLAVSIFGTSGDVGAITSDNILVTVDLADFGSAVGTYTVPAEVTVVGHDVGVSGGTYQVRVTISEQTSDQPAEPDTPAGETPDTGDETT